MDYNYHTHTKYCHHASGEMEEYVKRSIENGIRHLGFSEHLPFSFPDGGESSFYRIYLADVPTYLKEANRLREVYKNQIDIKIGYEMEYYPLYFKEMLKSALDNNAEYLILGQHYLQNEYPNGYPSGAKTTNDEDIVEYVDCVLKGMETGIFSYVAHPDLLDYIGDNDALYEQEMRKICVASKKYNIPLEINFNGARDLCVYPGDRFFAIAGEVGCPVTFGMDAHTAIDAYDEKNLMMAKEMVKRHNLNYIGKPKLVLLQEQKDEIMKKLSLA